AIYIPQHFISHPTVWPQPLLVLARIVVEAPQVKLATGIMLLPFLNPVQVAEQVATMDHLCKGRFILGVGLGYRQVELGLGRQRELSDWAIVGAPEDCREAFSKMRQESGITYVGLSFLNLPAGHKARLEYLQRVAEEVIQARF
ncbi:MAG: LLM class flavin-dependent oxidoreductase, partial [bacterium]|nr:LLM class flavin-dependent oxidoreductase [bacterium]